MSTQIVSITQGVINRAIQSSQLDHLNFLFFVLYLPFNERFSSNEMVNSRQEDERREVMLNAFSVTD